MDNQKPQQLNNQTSDQPSGPKTFQLYSGRRTPTLIQIIAGLMWLVAAIQIVSGLIRLDFVVGGLTLERVPDLISTFTSPYESFTKIGFIIFIIIIAILIGVGVFGIKTGISLFRMKKVAIRNSIIFAILIAGIAAWSLISTEFTARLAENIIEIMEILYAILLVLIIIRYKERFNQATSANLLQKSKFNLKYFFIILGLAILISSGILAYQYWWLPKHEIKPPELTIASETADWKTYENQDLGFSFKYPNTWKDIELTKQNNDISGFPGTLYSSYGETGLNYFDPDDIFSFFIFSKDYEPYEVFGLNNKEVNTNWSTSEFALNMNIDPAAILFTKKLSEKSMLVALYQSPECSPGMSLKVIAPLTGNYPNFEISISDKEAFNDPLIKTYEDEQIAKNGVGCDMLGGYQQVADKILNGAYPELNKNIEIARKIADSLTLSETAGWQTYRNEEYGFEMKYPQGWVIEEKDELLGEVSTKEFSLHKIGEDPRNERVAHITILPKGFTTGLPNAVNVDREEIYFAGRKADTIRFLTEKGDVWWQMISGISNLPSDWGINSYIIISPNITNFRSECAVHIPPGGECSLADGQKFFGGINQDDWKQLNQILSTFKFIDQTANWQTYRNEEYGFEVKYPTSWFIYKDNPSDIFIQKEEEKSGIIPGPHADAFEIKAIAISSSIALDQAVKNALPGLNFTKERINIGGVEGLKIKTTCEGVGCGAPQWFIIKNDNLYQFNSNLGYSNTFDQILSTFKFTK